MHHKSLRQLAKSGIFWIALVALAVMPALRATAFAADLSEQAHSLKSVPADTAFYSASLRLKEQWNIFRDSKAYSKLMEIPLVQLVKMQAAFQFQQSPEPTVAKIREYFASDEGKESIEVLKEMFSEEVFAYGGNDITQMFQLFMELNNVRRTAQLEAMAAGEDADQVMAKQVLETLEKHGKDFKVPTMVFGFRIADAKRAQGQLDEVHSMLRNVLDEHQPEIAEHLQRDQIAGHEFLTLRLDGSMIPWEKVKEEAGEDDQEKIEEWRKMISSKTLVVALGVVEEFVLVSVGASTDNLENIGQGPFLADNKDIKRLAKHADEKIVSIGYMSEAFAREVSSPQKTIEDMVGAAEEIMGGAEVPEEQQKQIVEDIRALDIEKYVPKPGTVASIGFLTDQGYEGFRYNNARPKMLDSSKPLSILNYAGGSPTFVLAGRSKENSQDYEQSVAWLKRFAGHVEKIVEDKAEPKDWEKYQQHRSEIVELLERLDKANRELLLPAFADGQSAVIVDLAATSKQWVDKMPESPKPLPMPAFALAMNVADAGKLEKGMREYMAVLQDALALMHEIDPEDTPEIKVPKPKKREASGGGTLYVFPLPEEWGIDPKVAVCGGIGEKVAVLSTMPDTTERLMQDTPLSADSAVKLDQPAAVLVHVEIAKAIGAIRPWIDYGFDVAIGKLKPKADTEEDGDVADSDSDDDAPVEQSPMLMQMGFVIPQIHQFLDVAAAFKSASAVTYEEDGVWVTHSATHIVDLK
jgi:hypothetical protein